MYRFLVALYSCSLEFILLLNWGMCMYWGLNWGMCWGWKPYIFIRIKVSVCISWAFMSKITRMKKWERHKKSLCEYWYVSPQGNCIFKTWSAAVLCFNFLFEEVETHKQSFQVSHANMNWKTNTDTQIQNILACVA